MPVAFIAASNPDLTTDDLSQQCRAALAGYKQPKQIQFVALGDLPRSTTGKIQRHEVEKWLTDTRTAGNLYSRVKSRLIPQAQYIGQRA